MSGIGPRMSFALLVAVTLVAWGIPVFEYLAYGAMSVVSLVTALMLSSMLAVWPFVTGRRVHGGHLERALMCVECRSFVWPAEEVFGFCLRCGSTRRAVPVHA